jgi:hypothetical protein
MVCMRINLILKILLIVENNYIKIYFLLYLNLKSSLKKKIIRYINFKLDF